MKKKVTATQIAHLLARALIVPTASLPALGILLYFIGWQYVNEYFSTFGVNRSSFEFKEYTVFLYAFSVAAALPRMVLAQPETLAYSVVLIAFGCTCPFWIKRVPPSLPRLMILRVVLWASFLIAFFLLGQGAGRQEASDVLNHQARQVKVYFTDSFAKHLAANLSEEEAVQRLEGIRLASQSNALAIIWRSDGESIFLLFGSQGPIHGKPLEILRIGNSHIAMIISLPPTLETGR